MPYPHGENQPAYAIAQETIARVPSHNGPPQPTHIYIGAWAAKASVLVDPIAFLSGEVDIFARLRAISQSEIQRMQAVIAQHAHSLVYGLHGDVSSASSLSPHMAYAHASPPPHTSPPSHR